MTLSGITDVTSRLQTGDPDICGLCGRKKADKYAKWVYLYPYLEGEQVPRNCKVHEVCERAEYNRALEQIRIQQDAYLNEHIRQLFHQQPGNTNSDGTATKGDDHE